MIDSLMESAVIASFILFILCLLAWAIAPFTETAPKTHDDE